MITFKAENGETLIARDENQAAAFEKAGLVRVEEEVKPTKTKKEQE